MRFLFAILCAVLFLNGSSLAAATKDTRWTEWEKVSFGMPYLGHAVKPQRGGVVNAILTEVFEGAEIDFEHVALPYTRALREVRQGKLDLTLDVENNRKGVLHGTTTMVFYDLSVAFLRSSGFEGMKSMANERVAYLHGFNIEKYLPVPVKTHLVYALSSAFHLLELGEVKYVLGDYELLKNALHESGLADTSQVIQRLKSYRVHPIFAPTEKGRRYRAVYERRLRR